MGFDSIFFLLFVPLIVFFYYVLPRRTRPYYLLVVSYLIYGSFSWWLLFLLAGVSISSYVFGLLIWRADSKGAKQAWLTLSLIVLLGSLFVFKYLDFALGASFSLFAVFGLDIPYHSLGIILPVGISFYTFQSIAYLVDVYRDEIEAEQNPFIFMLFVSFFPQLVAGPIEKAKDLLPQLKEPKNFKLEYIQDALPDIVAGYIKKIAIADFFGVYVAQVAGSMDANSGLSIFLSLFAFSFQIYGDFAGYSQIALGLGKALGIDLSKNFDRPYLSSSFREFWRRWHITLNRFFVEYVYIPLGGNRKGRWRMVFNILVVFLFSGLWHGADLRYVLWGLIWGLLVVIESLIPQKEGEPVRWKKLLKSIGVFLITSFLWLFFFPNSLHDSFSAIRILFTGWGRGADLSFFNWLNIIIAILAAIYIFVDPRLPRLSFIYKDEERKDPHVLKSLGVVGLYVLGALIIGGMWVYVDSLGGGGSFIYFQF